MKKLSTLLICFLIMLTCVFTGCATFSINKVKYYNEVLAKVGNEKITRFEVLSAYNSYGKSYYNQQLGKSEKESIEKTLDLLIDRELIYQSAKKDAKYKPTASQVNAIVEEMFTSLDSQMNSYLSTALNMLDIEEVKTETNSNNETVYLFKDYSFDDEDRRAELVSTTTYYTTAEKTTISSTPTEFFDVKYSIKYNIPEEEPYKPVIDEAYLQNFEKDGIIDVIREEYKHRLETRLNEDYAANGKVIYNKVMQLFVNDLLDYERYLLNDNGKPFNKVEKDLINRYFERTFTSQIQGQYLENVRTEYLENETLSITAIMEKFDSKMVSSYSQYANRPSSYATAMKDIGTKGDTILYHPNLEDTEFGYFIHTLLSFSDEQKTAIKNLDKDDIFYNDDYAAIIAGTEVDYRGKDGKVAGKAKLADIVEEYQEITKLPDYNTKMDTFIQFMFTYTGDTATLSAGMPYVVGTNGNSSMVEAFTNEAIKLMETETLGAMSEVDMNNIESFCITEYGIHFIFYVNEVDAYDFPYAEKDSVTILDLNKELNPLTGKTYFDMLFDEVYPAGSAEEVYTSNTGYSEFETNLINDVKTEVKVIKYRTKINGTKTNI